MSYERNIKWLNDRRIVYRHDGDDIPTIETSKYKYYENGTHACYSLFNTKAKITTYKSLKWHFLVLYYLNKELQVRHGYTRIVFRFIANKENGFVTFFISKSKLESIMSDVLMYGGEPPKNKLRKVIFKDYSMLTINEKLKIVGKLIGRSSIDKKSIYSAMLILNDDGFIITVKWLAKLLNVSQRTVYRHMCDDLKKEKQRLNEKI